jgi:hypothetical protein
LQQLNLKLEELSPQRDWYQRLILDYWSIGVLPGFLITTLQYAITPVRHNRHTLELQGILGVLIFWNIPWK